MVENASSRAPGHWLFRKIPDIPTARKIGRLGFWAAAYMAVTIAVFAVPKRPLQVIDLIPYVLVAVGIWKLWRTAAILGLCLETYEAVWMWMRHRTEMEILDWIKEVILILLFIMSVRGTFEYHRLMRQASQQKNPLPETETPSRQSP